MMIGQCSCSGSTMGILDVAILVGVGSIIMLILFAAGKKKETGTENKMNSKYFSIVAIVVLALGLAFVVKQKITSTPATEKGTGQVTATSRPAYSSEQSLPRLLDLGATKCIPCKMMKPILEELKKEYEGRMQVEFIDVWENPAAGEQYGIRSIPTQIFYDTAGQERYRHVGFFSKADILAKWKELGVRFDHGSQKQSTSSPSSAK